MAYSEQIKDFGKIRETLRQFYVYGFKSRREYNQKSLRSYDNERRRLENWLGDSMRFRQDPDGKRLFLSVDAQSVPANPLYRAFKAKSFTSGDIAFHFYILDLLAQGKACTLRQILDAFSTEYLSCFPGAAEPDESSVRKKLKEYGKLGLLKVEKQGRELLYHRAESQVELEAWKEAAAFFSEENPLGVIGSYLLDRYRETPDWFRFKHHYLLHALDSEVLYKLLEALGEERAVRIQVKSRRKEKRHAHTVRPVKIFISTQTCRQYLLGWEETSRKLEFYRLDLILSVKPAGAAEPAKSGVSGAAEPVKSGVSGAAEPAGSPELPGGKPAGTGGMPPGAYEEFARYLWGVSGSSGQKTERVEMVVRVEPGQEFVADRLRREKRCGTVVRLDGIHWRYEAEVYDAREMLPWLRTFLGRIQRFSCSNPEVEETFRQDLEEMYRLYGGKEDVVS